MMYAAIITSIIAVCYITRLIVDSRLKIKQLEKALESKNIKNISIS